jgi:hypothetical protein
MYSDKKSARIIAALFLISTGAFLMGDSIISPIVYSTEYLKNVFPNAAKVNMGMLLIMINNIAIVGIAFMMYPILKRYNERIALAYFASRIIESVLIIVSLVNLLSIVDLSREYLQTSTADAAYFDTLGTLFKAERYYNFQMAMILLALGSLLFCYLLYRSNLIPRILTVLGFIGYICLFVKMIFDLFELNLGGDILYLPGAMFELLLPIWLIFKGFNTSSVEKNALDSV